MRKACRNVFNALTSAVFLSANLFSLQTSSRLKAAAFGISYNYNYIFYLPVQC